MNFDGPRDAERVDVAPLLNPPFASRKPSVGPRPQSSTDDAADLHRQEARGRRAAIEFLLTLVLAVLLLRTFVVEAYVVPSGSMAPTLLGHHKRIFCPRCGVTFAVGVDEDGSCRVQHCPCPNCELEDLDVESAPVSSGDRLLVEKSIFGYRPPARWSPVVFRTPGDPRQAYVKRAVGLPGEAVRLAGGDVYIDGRIARKTLPELLDMALPVFDQARLTDQKLVEDRYAVDADSPGWEIIGNELQFSSARSPRRAGRIAYRHLQRGEESCIRDFSSYNPESVSWERSPVGDLILRVEIELQEAGGFLEIQYRAAAGREFTCRLDFYRAVIEVVRAGKIERSAPLDWPTGRRQELLIAYWDQTAGVRLDGRPCFTDLEWDEKPCDKSARGTPASRPFNFFGDAAVRLRGLRIDRDVYYTTTVCGNAHPTGVDKPYQLKAGEYFMLGDNSAISRDSRLWDQPAVPENMLVGKPVLVHLPSRAWKAPFNGRILQLPDFQRIRSIK